MLPGCDGVCEKRDEDRPGCSHTRLQARGDRHETQTTPTDEALHPDHDRRHDGDALSRLCQSRGRYRRRPYALASAEGLVDLYRARPAGLGCRFEAESGVVSIVLSGRSCLGRYLAPSTVSCSFGRTERHDRLCGVPRACRVVSNDGRSCAQHMRSCEQRSGLRGQM
jgi:hypothetical protein